MVLQEEGISGQKREFWNFSCTSQANVVQLSLRTFQLVLVYIYNMFPLTTYWVWVCILYSKGWFPHDTIIQIVITTKYTLENAKELLIGSTITFPSFHFLFLITQVILLAVGLLGSARGRTHTTSSNLNMANDSPFSSLL